MLKQIGIEIKNNNNLDDGKFLNEPDIETIQLKFQNRLEENCSKILKVLGDGSGAGVEFISERLKNDINSGDPCCREDMWCIGDNLSHLMETLELKK